MDARVTPGRVQCVDARVTPGLTIICLRFSGMKRIH